MEPVVCAREACNSRELCLANKEVDISELVTITVELASGACLVIEWRSTCVQTLPNISKSSNSECYDSPKQSSGHEKEGEDVLMLTGSSIILVRLCLLGDLYCGALPSQEPFEWPTTTGCSHRSLCCVLVILYRCPNCRVCYGLNHCRIEIVHE